MARKRYFAAVDALIRTGHEILVTGRISGGHLEDALRTLIASPERQSVLETLDQLDAFLLFLRRNRACIEERLRGAP